MLVTQLLLFLYASLAVQTSVTGLERVPASATQAAPLTVSGDWTLEMRHPDGEKTSFALSLRLDGEKLSGEATFGSRKSKITGTVKGEVVQFTRTSSVDDHDSEPTHYEGRLNRTDWTMSGKWQVAEGAVVGQWIATRPVRTD